MLLRSEIGRILQRWRMEKDARITNLTRWMEVQISNFTGAVGVGQLQTTQHGIWTTLARMKDI